MMEKVDVLEKYENKLIKILFRDGTSVRSIKGRLTSFSSDFVGIRTLSNDFLINRSDIIKIQTTSGGNSNGEKE